MSPPSTSPATAPQIISSEEVTNQTLMSVIVGLRAQLTSMSRRQDELIELVLDLRRELATRAEPTVHTHSNTVHSTPEPASPIVPQEAEPVATDSVPSSSQGAESAVGPPANWPTRPIPAPERRIRRQNAFYHISNAEEAPWRAPGGYHPYCDGTHPTRGRSTPERSAPPSPRSLHPPVSPQRVPDSRGGSDHLSPPDSPSPLRLPAPQESQSSPSLPIPPLPQARGTPTLPLPEATTTLPSQPAPTPRTRPLRREGAFYHTSWLARAPFRAPGPGIFQPPPYPPTTASTPPAAPLPSPKRKREDTEDSTDGDEASDKKRTRRPSADDVD
ncbi:hypothetical protein BDM02DRAFT_3107313 [Thelephora ganbajun]|uniref:Uncharacterized protein n=1 Tax=Thelephora ganbajun TaxID=370292 RepID=A0ACB6ZX92_THEGA|nr:hypothetical protein BDM02DRAFT_3107313 [Thelephora ganbajun]